MRIPASFTVTRLLESSRARPNLPFSKFSVREMLERTKLDLFPEITVPVYLRFVSRGPLACIVDHGTSADIFVHQILNHPDTPAEAFQTVIKHELLHLMIPPVWGGETEQQHPQAFWDAERLLSPERRETWEWIYLNLWGSLRIEKRLQGIFVRGNWRGTWSQGYGPYETPRFPENLNIPDVDDAGW